MSRILFQDQSPVTQTIDSGKALAQFLSLGEDLPQVIPLANGARLSLSSKRDCYYFTNSRGCSCRAGQFGRDCKRDYSRPLKGTGFYGLNTDRL